MIESLTRRHIVIRTSDAVYLRAQEGRCFHKTYLRSKWKSCLSLFVGHFFNRPIKRP